MQVRKIRLEQGLSVPKLAELSGLSRRTIQEVERRDECTVSTAKKLAAALGVSLDTLCQADTEPTE